jgi:hypothetical protein
MVGTGAFGRGSCVPLAVGESLVLVVLELQPAAGVVAGVVVAGVVVVAMVVAAMVLPEPPSAKGTPPMLVMS